MIPKGFNVTQLLHWHISGCQGVWNHHAKGPWLLEMLLPCDLMGMLGSWNIDGPKQKKTLQTWKTHLKSMTFYSLYEILCSGMQYPWVFGDWTSYVCFFSIFAASGRKCQEFDLQKVMCFGAREVGNFLVSANGTLVVGDGILWIPLIRDPFHKVILGLQTTGPKPPINHWEYDSYLFCFPVPSDIPRDIPCIACDHCDHFPGMMTF